jgi:hypothetical protein
VAVSFTATLVICELAVCRYRITLLLFGMKPDSAPRSSVHGADIPDGHLRGPRSIGVDAGT